VLLLTDNCAMCGGLPMLHAKVGYMWCHQPQQDPTSRNVSPWLHNELRLHDLYVAWAWVQSLLLCQPSLRKDTPCASSACTFSLAPALTALLLLLQLSARNTSLGSACNPNGGCGPSHYSSLMIVLSCLLGSFALCLLQRHICWRCRVAGLLAEAQVGRRGDTLYAGAGHQTV
jgi:hypothetical protein